MLNYKFLAFEREITDSNNIIKKENGIFKSNGIIQFVNKIPKKVKFSVLFVDYSKKGGKELFDAFMETKKITDTMINALVIIDVEKVYFEKSTLEYIQSPDVIRETSKHIRKQALIHPTQGLQQKFLRDYKNVKIDENQVQTAQFETENEAIEWLILV